MLGNGQLKVFRLIAVFKGNQIDLPFLVICKEGVGNPDFFSKVPGKSEHFVLLRAERQPLVLPVLVQVHRYCVILKKKKHTFNNNIFSSAIISNMSYHKFPTNDILKTKLWKNCYFVLKTHHANFWYWIKTCYCQVKPYIQGVSWKKRNIRTKPFSNISPNPNQLLG